MADIEAISRYTKAEWGETQAKRYILDLYERITFAAEFPGAGSGVIGLPAEYRKVRAGSHRAIYRSTESELIVVRIVHEREDVPDDAEGFW